LRCIGNKCTDAATANRERGNYEAGELSGSADGENDGLVNGESPSTRTEEGKATVDELRDPFGIKCASVYVRCYAYAALNNRIDVNTVFHRWDAATSHMSNLLIASELIGVKKLTKLPSRSLNKR
jgi:hypothetical protein